MNRIAILAVSLAVALPAIGDNSMVLNGVKYTIEKDRWATASAVKAKDPKLEILQIPTLININNTSVFVYRIAKNGFRGCPNLRSVVLPNSIKYIGADAFSDCRNLESAILPDETTVEILPTNFGSGGNGPFKGCTKLSAIRGNNSTLPDYVLTDALKECYEVPFTYNMSKGNTENITAVYSQSGNDVPSFSKFAETKVKQPMEMWEKRKPYESSSEYKDRVTDASREAKLKELLAQAREEYLAMYAPAGISGTVEYYDPDYNVFTIDTHSFGEIYAKVPKDEAETFRNRWNAVRMMPRFGILGDRLAVLSCSFSLDGKTYVSESTYTDETESGYKNMLRPLSELLAENTVGVTDTSAPSTATTVKRVVDPVDLKIPATGVKDNRTFALIIGNEHYQGNIKSVPYAANDAEIFSKYCRRTLGLPEANVKLITDATLGQLTSAIEEIKHKAKALKGEARIIFYYSGHGKPDDNDRQAYMVPVDASPYSNRTNYSLSELYRELAEADAKLVTVFLDACFSGATRNDDMLVAARAMRQVPREETPLGNMVVFTAASDAETAYPIESKSHGVFTYALLDKLQTTEGKVSLGELADHIMRSVTDLSLSANRPQNPKVLVSPALSDWSSISLRK